MQHLPQGSIMGLALEVVLQGLQAAASVFSRQGCFQNKICKYRIFGQDRPVAVGTECVFVPRSFRFVLSIVSEALQHCAQRANVISQVRSSAVVFKADDRVLSRIISEPVGIVSDHSLLSSDCIKIDGAQEFTDMPFLRLIVMAHHLIAAADA